MNTHPHGEQISAYLDGMLDVARMRTVALHLQACPKCQTVYEDLRRTKRLLAAVPAPVVPSSEFWTNTYRRLRTEGETPGHSGLFEGWGNSLRHGWQSSQRRWGAGLAATAAVGAVILTPLLTVHAPAPVTAPPVVQTAADDAVDMSSLVRAHTDSAAVQPLSDPDRQAMISADADNAPLSDPAFPEAASHADSTP